LTSPWLVERNSASRPRVRIVAVPFAGSGASAFLPWSDLLPADVALAVVRLPGRESRFRDRPMTAMSEVVAQLAPAVRSLGNTPTVVFGYSLGALIGYELALSLTAAGSPPVLLAVGGAEAPHLERTFPSIANLDDAEFDKALRALGGTPDEVFEHPELLDIIRSTLRADFALLEAYSAGNNPPRPLPMPITTYCGRNDRELTPAGVSGWADLSSVSAAHREFAGGHFFLLDDPETLVGALLTDVDTTLRGPSLSESSQVP
jgi:surfactin synthase thioesterase subunit